MNGFAAERLMELEVGAATGAAYRQEQPAAAGPAQRRPRAGLGDAGRTVELRIPFRRYTPTHQSAERAACPGGVVV
jgi:putative transposase